MAITTSTRFVTTDGKTFETELLAKAHEASIELKKALPRKVRDQLKDKATAISLLALMIKAAGVTLEDLAEVA